MSIPVPWHLHEPKDESLSANGWDNFLGTNYIVVTVTCLLGGVLGVLYALLAPSVVVVPHAMFIMENLRSSTFRIETGDVVFFSEQRRLF